MTTKPPIPKYGIGDIIAFDRADSDYGAENEGTRVGVITEIEIHIFSHLIRCGSHSISPGTWIVHYSIAKDDEPVPERCVLGICEVKKK